MAAEEQTDVDDLLKELSVWEEQKRQRDAELEARLIAAEEAAAEKLAAIRLVRSQRSSAKADVAVSAAGRVATSTPDHAATTHASKTASAGHLTARAAIYAVLRARNDLSFAELLLGVQSIRPPTQSGTMHSELARLKREGKIRFDGARGNMTYHLMPDSESTDPQQRLAQPSIATRILSALRNSPRLPLGELAEQAFGDQSDGSLRKVRGMLNHLQQQGEVRPVANGEWEVNV